jgi:hypothetical protein
MRPQDPFEVGDFLADLIVLLLAVSAVAGVIAVLFFGLP